MANIKYKVIASYTERVYFSKIYELDDAEFDDDGEIMDYVGDLAYEDTLNFDPSEWDEEGSEDTGGGVSVDEIVKLVKPTSLPPSLE